MERFEVGKEYTGSFDYDRNCKVTIKIEKRTASTVSYYEKIDGGELKLVRKKISPTEDCERVFYSKRGGNFCAIRAI